MSEHATTGNDENEADSTKGIQRWISLIVKFLVAVLIAVALYFIFRDTSGGQDYYRPRPTGDGDRQPPAPVPTAAPPAPTPVPTPVDLDQQMIEENRRIRQRDLAPGGGGGSRLQRVRPRRSQ